MIRIRIKIKEFWIADWGFGGREGRPTSSLGGEKFVVM